MTSKAPHEPHAHGFVAYDNHPFVGNEALPGLALRRVYPVVSNTAVESDYSGIRIVRYSCY